MAAEIKIVTYYSIEIANKAGAGAKALSALKHEGVNLVGLWGYPVKGKKARLDVIPEDAKAFPKQAKRAGLDAGPKLQSFYWTGEDHPGAMAEALAALAAAGVSAYAAQAICGGNGRFGGCIQVAADDFKKARKALGAK